MSFVTGLLLIDAPASALNNLGSIPGARTDNTVGVKMIKARDGAYPYVSAQAFRYWLRATLEDAQIGWQKARIYREEKVAYTDANPILFWDDDLFGYMRAPSGKKSAQEKRAADTSRAGETPTSDTITRVSPFRVSTLVSIAPVSVTEDFGVMARHEGDPVPHEHQFYRTTLKGLFSLDGRIEMARQRGLELVEADKSYRLPLAERVQRVKTLFEGLAHLEGGAKQTLHYTDVAPALTIMAVTRGGNHIFGHVVGATGRGQPEFKLDALAEALTVFADDLLSAVYIGWTRGYLDDERGRFEQALQDCGLLAPFRGQIQIAHPRVAFQAMAAALAAPGHEGWLD